MHRTISVLHCDAPFGKLRNWEARIMAKGPRGSSTSDVLIKKYGNRRLYDTTQSQYITLEDLADIVKAGSKVRVVEASTDRDLTRQVLTQVILEQQESLDMFPIDLLHAAIRVRGTLDQAPFTAFLSTVTRQLASTGNVWTDQLASLFGGSPAPSTPNGEAAPTTAADDAPDKSADDDASPLPDQPLAESPSDEATPPAGKDLSNIRDRMDKLLGKLSKGPMPK